MKDFIPVISALIGVLLGGILQYFLGRRVRRAESFEKLQGDAYVDFMRGAAGVAMAQCFKDEKAEFTATSLMLDAKIRIGIYGDPLVARAVGEFFEKYGDMSKIEDMKAFVALMHTMRSSIVGAADSADWTALSRILFSRDIQPSGAFQRK